MFQKRELGAFAVAVLVMALALAFDDGRETLDLGFWFSNLFLTLVIVAVGFFAHQLAHKIVARKHGFETAFSLWGLKNLWFSPLRVAKGYNMFPRTVRVFGKEYVIQSFPVGVVLALLVMLFSMGSLFFLALGQYTLLLKPGRRFGRKFVEVTDFEEAQIALAGPLVHIVFVLLFSFFNTYGSFEKVIFINAALALFYMIPVHQLDGAKILLGSPLLYVISLVFMIAVVVLVQFLSLVPLLLVTGVATVVAGLLFYYFVYLKY